MAVSTVKLNGTTLMTVNDTTAVASDVASGKYFYKADGVKTAGTSSGGGGGPIRQNHVNFYDYDGTLLHSYTPEEFAELSNLPSNPTHTGLTSQGWNWTKAQISTQLTSAPKEDVNVGQMYITDDGKTRVYVHMEEGRLHPYLGVAPNGTVIVDWGDGSSTDTLTGTTLTTIKNTNHVYASAGDYVITLTVSSGSFGFYGLTTTSYSTNLLKKQDNMSANASKVYANCIQKVEIGNNVVIGMGSFLYCTSMESITIPDGVTSIGNNAFYNCYNLTSITIPDGVTSIGNYAFYGCYNLTSITIPDGVTSIGAYAFQICFSLTSITIPDGVTSIGTYAFYTCYSLTSITIPDSVTSIGTYAFYNCYSLTSITIPDGVTSISTYAFYNCHSLTSITIPDGVTSIGNYAFQDCYSLTSITIPDGVTSIGTYAFGGCYGLGEIHFTGTTPPTVSNSNAWANIPTDCIIYVPTGTLTDYTTATNYPSSATYTYVEE